MNDLNHPDPPGGGLTAQNDRIRRVRVTVLAVAPLEDQANSATGHLSYGRPKIANRDAATVADRLRRRAFSASIMPRNVIGVIDPEISMTHSEHCRLELSAACATRAVWLS